MKPPLGVNGRAKYFGLNSWVSSKAPLGRYFARIDELVNTSAIGMLPAQKQHAVLHALVCYGLEEDGDLEDYLCEGNRVLGKEEWPEAIYLAAWCVLVAYFGRLDVAES
jgi:hypothetical protein